MENKLTLLFQGDSITNCGRDSDESLGYGYVKKIHTRLVNENIIANPYIINRGVSGDRVKDLKNRWEQDCISLNPDVLTIMIGVNDCARRYDSNDAVSAESFERDYIDIVSQAKSISPHIQIILMEPFLIPLLDNLNEWRDDLDPKICIVKKIAKELNCFLINLDSIFAGVEIPNEYLTYDGIHLLDKGHEIIADIWFNHFINNILHKFK